MRRTTTAFALAGALLPAPVMATSETLASGLAVAEMPVEMVTMRINAQTSSTVFARGKTAGERITLIAQRDVPLQRVLDQIVAQKPDWLWYTPPDKPDTFEIWDQPSFRQQVMPTQVRERVYKPQEISAEEAFKATRGLLTPNLGTSAFDPRSNKLIVTDLPQVLETIQRTIEQIDIKFTMRVFQLKKADARDLAEKLATLKSPGAPHPLVDERTRQIIIFDQPEKIQRMEMVVNTFDI